MKANADKCRVLLNKSNELTVKINELQFKNSQSEKLLGITIDNDSKFEDHVNNICSKASVKIAPYMGLPKRKQIMNAFFKSKFSYSPLTRMMHSRKLNKMNWLHERCLRATNNDGLSSFEALLERDNSVSVSNRKKRYLAIELYKVFNGICPEIMKDVFLLSISSNYDTRSRRTFITRLVKTVYYRTESLFYLAPKAWELIPVT